MQLRTSLLRSAALLSVLTSASIVMPPTFAQQTDVPSAPAPAALSFPPTNPANFTASTPTRATIEQFLKQSWGYDPDRIWQIWAILNTQAPGVSRVMVQVIQKGSGQTQPAMLTFLTTSDGKHLISSDLNILAFGEHPYADIDRTLRARAEGPSRGAADKKFELVEFADFQCPHCKATQPIMDRLLADFPQAHFVYENYPLVSVHSEAFKAAAYSVCVAQESGDAAFFKFADAVFATQQNLTPQGSDAALADAATKTGLDPAKVGACSYTSVAKAKVDASIKLAQDLGIDETPMLFINGRQIPVGEVANNQLPYETLKQIVAYQFTLDQ